MYNFIERMINFMSNRSWCFSSVGELEWLSRFVDDSSANIPADSLAGTCLRSAKQTHDHKGQSDPSLKLNGEATISLSTKARTESSRDSTKGNGQGTRAKIERGERRQTRESGTQVSRVKEWTEWVVNGFIT
ncbi:hypothetical protein EUGRSUZ_E01488 [Eucalyptus grandis]|uniref:Uncharacterized protein n=2 Tax=Eucalyptus grandis TaxID=71139 RepID=A0ACC3KUJ8_EUCGR|nr:hypothetical protein EUGRSUZ_E01488 [Eucalyptus grandis]